MARLNQDQTRETKVPGVNIAGDFSLRGTDIAPDAMTESDFEGRTEAGDAMETVAPSDQIQLSPDDSRHMQAQREKVKRESMKAGEAKIVNPSKNSNVNTDWPVDE